LNKNEYEKTFGNETSGKFYPNLREIYVNIYSGMCTLNHELTHYIIDLGGIDLKSFDSEGIARFFEATITYYPQKQDQIPSEIKNANMFISTNKDSFH
jgi:hypothetical protein